MPDVSTEEQTLPKTVTMPEAGVKNGGVDFSNLKSWLDRKRPSLQFEPFVIPATSNYVANENDAVDPKIMSPQQKYNQSSSDNCSRDKSSSKKGLKRKSVHQDGSSPKRRAISTSMNITCNEIQHEDKDFTTNMPVSTTSNNSLAGTNKPPGCSNDGYSSISSVDETIARVSAGIFNTGVDDVTESKTPSKQKHAVSAKTKAISSTKNDNQKHAAKKDKPLNSTNNSAAVLLPTPPKVTAQMHLQNQNPDIYQQLLQLGWTPPPNVAGRLSNLTGMQLNTNVVTAPVLSNTPIDTSFSIFQDEKRPKKKKKKAKSSSKHKNASVKQEQGILSPRTLNSTTDEIFNVKKKSKKKKKDKAAT